NADGSLKGTTTGALASNTGIDLFNGLTSWDTLGSMANTKAGQTFVTGMTAKLEVVFTDPVPRAALTSAPYDLFLRVINTGKDIHFLGRYFNADGTDKYLDPKGFPWALLVPGNWKWPYERQNIHQSYQFFFDWYSTAGKISADWYNFPNLDLVYPAP
ncbi:MAG: LruC domain-containing protein, partial [Spirochaetia bacterium]|nr:LruC domain-containing protein [Spirochaetia bacterium]